MKKTALVFGIFSLVLVASFANPATVSNNKNKVALDGGGGQLTRPTRKVDFHSEKIQLKSFASASQATRSTVKLD